MADGRRSSSLGKQFVCQVCEASFPYPSKLKRHLRSRKHSLLESSNRVRDDGLGLHSIAVDSALEHKVSLNHTNAVKNAVSSPLMHAGVSSTGIPRGVLHLMCCMHGVP